MPESILHRVAAGDPGAIQEVLDRYGALVWALARRFSGSQHDAEDAVQEIFVDLWKSAGRYDPSVASEATFISMIARRRLIDRRRRAVRRQEITEARPLEDGDRPPTPAAPGPLSPAERLEQADDAARAARALGELREDQQKVLRLSIYQGLSHERISEATGLPLGTVKTHVRRGLMRLREILGGAAEMPQQSRRSLGIPSP